MGGNGAEIQTAAHSTQHDNMNAPNRNILQARIFVEELARSGVKAVVIAPGSRSTPLAFAFAEQPRIQVYSLLDERGAAFFALGLANASQIPVALLCTSGTATANFYPAIVEAHYAAIPLIVLTADRSPELRESGANQTVDQIKMYGDHVLWSVDVGLPEAQPPAVALRNLRTLANRAVYVANGYPKGAVHLNFPFRKPLAPTFNEGDQSQDNHQRADDRAFTQMTRGIAHVSDQVMKAFTEVVNASQFPLIIAGPRTTADVLPYAKSHHIPVLADALSRQRFISQSEGVISTYETFLKAGKDWQPPDLVIQIGSQPISQALDDYLIASNPDRWFFISEDGRWQDPNHMITDFIHAHAPTFFFEALPQTESVSSARLKWERDWQIAEQETAAIFRQQCSDQFFDGAIVHHALEQMPEESLLFVGSSLPVRHLDQFGLATLKNISTFCNRGASGIDGTIASAVGVGASAPDRLLVIILGDIAFYHDMNSVLALQRCGVKATIVVINNDGGGIFYRLPIAEHEPTFTELFVTPHGLSFEGAAQMFGLNYVRAEAIPSFRAAFVESFASSKSTLIEVPTDAKRDLEIRNDIIRKVAEKLSMFASKEENR
jgi:2-succinyl-5-enolpyruvyl-6-hydroxy-3-cyclohexene-1-carboxylate synthase